MLQYFGAEDEEENEEAVVNSRIASAATSVMVMESSIVMRRANRFCTASRNTGKLPPSTAVTASTSISFTCGRMPDQLTCGDSYHQENNDIRTLDTAAFPVLLEAAVSHIAGGRAGMMIGKRSPCLLRCAD
jgi:hypothetical protein